MSNETTETGTILDRIVAGKRDELEQRQRDEPIDALKRRIAELDEQWSLTQAILEGPRGPHGGGKRIQLIAEIKKASPSKGRLVSILEHRAIARTYTIGGAVGISIVTERKHFQGEIQFMLDVRMSMRGYYPGGRPANLRKDFLFDPYHVWEARGYGADAILLIVAILGDPQLRDLIGINNRDLHTFEVDVATTERLRPLIPDDKVVISESGIATRADTERVAAAGVHAVLVGEALIVASDVREKMRDFLV